MPLETKKVLWTVMSVVIVLVVASGIALALAFPRGGSSGAPATVAAVAPARAPSPDEYVRSFEPVPPQPAQAQPAPTSPTGLPGQGTTAPSSDIVIVYGDKPSAAALSAAATGAPSASGSPVAAAPGAGPASAGSTQAVATKPYSPAPAAAPKAPAQTAAPKAAAKPSAAASTPKAPAKPATIEEYWIQAAAFTSRSRADDLQRELAGKGLSTLITVKDIDGITRYRVRIGPYQSEREAKGWLDKIRVISGCSEAYVSRQTVSRSS